MACFMLERNDRKKSGIIFYKKLVFFEVKNMHLTLKHFVLLNYSRMQSIVIDILSQLEVGG